MIRHCNKSLFIVAFLFSGFGFAQDQESNLLKFTPAVLFQQGGWDTQIYSSIYSQTFVRDRNGDSQFLDHRATFLTTFLDFNFGINQRINIGAELYFNRTSIDPNNQSSLNVLLNDDQTSYRAGFSFFGPKVRWQPVKSLPTLSIQSTFLFPLAKNLETPIFLNHDRYTWYTQLFYDHAFSSKVRLFTDVGFLYRINRASTSSGNFFRVPIAFFLNYFPISTVSIFGFGQYSPRYGSISNEFTSIFGLTGWFTQIGLGAKYQVSPSIGLELSYSNLILSRNDGAGSNVNLGIRYIRK